MSPETLISYADRIETDLHDNILRFWMDRAIDADRQSFHGAITNDLVVDTEAERGALLSSRILWTFSAAYHSYADAAYRSTADLAYADLMKLYADRGHGGFIWSVTAAGKPAQTRKQIYGQAFAIYALAEYHRATGNPEPIETAINLFRLIERHAREPGFGGYREAFAQDWTPIEDMRLSALDLNTPKSQNTLLHVMEAYTGLFQVWPDPQLESALHELVLIFLDKILAPESHHLRLFFSDDWVPANDLISYGHDIEAAWLLTLAAEALGEPSLLERVRSVAVAIARAAQAQAIDEDGALLYAGVPEGITEFHKEWWVQNEALIGFLNAHQISGDASFLRTACGVWDFCEQHLIDRRHGEWFRAVSRNHQPDHGELKVSFWKCCYHNGRAGLEAPARLRAIVGRAAAPASRLQL